MFTNFLKALGIIYLITMVFLAFQSFMIFVYWPVVNRVREWHFNRELDRLINNRMERNEITD